MVFTLTHGLQRFIYNYHINSFLLKIQSWISVEEVVKHGTWYVQFKLEHLQNVSQTTRMLKCNSKQQFFIKK